MSPTCVHEWPLKFRLGTISPTVCVIRQTSAACIKTADILSQNNYILDCIVYWMGSNCWTRSIKTAGKNILNRGAQYRLNIGRTNLYRRQKKTETHIYFVGWLAVRITSSNEDLLSTFHGYLGNQPLVWDWNSLQVAEPSSVQAQHP